jgi:hypothetical protein
VQDRPTIDELLDAVEMFLRETVTDKLEGQPKFHARVAANALAIVRRELQLDATGEAAEVARLDVLMESDGNREQLNEQLAGLIRENEAMDAAAVLAHLRQTAIEKLAIANPKYRAET